MIQDLAGLLGRHSWKPLYELGNVRTVLQVLEKGGDRHTSAAEDPRPADAPRVALDRAAPMLQTGVHSS